MKNLQLVASFAITFLLANLYYQSSNELFIGALFLLGIAFHHFIGERFKIAIALLFVFTLLYSSLLIPYGETLFSAPGVLAFVFFAVLAAITLREYLVDKKC